MGDHGDRPERTTEDDQRERRARPRPDRATEALPTEGQKQWQGEIHSGGKMIADDVRSHPVADLPAGKVVLLLADPNRPRLRILNEPGRAHRRKERGTPGKIFFGALEVMPAEHDMIVVHRIDDPQPPDHQAGHCDRRAEHEAPQGTAAEVHCHDGRREPEKHLPDRRGRSPGIDGDRAPSQRIPL